ncbi:MULTISPECIES: SEC-C metal-binding domain-containing protein [unclassified Neorhizobium]
MNTLRGVGQIQVTPELSRRIELLQAENARISYQLAIRYTKRNDRCFCGSGKKFKHCHGGIAGR